MVLRQPVSTKVYRIVAVLLSLALFLQASPLAAGPDLYQSRSPAVSQPIAKHTSAPAAGPLAGYATPQPIALARSTAPELASANHPLAIPAPLAQISDSFTSQRAVATPVAEPVSPFLPIPSAILPPVLQPAIPIWYRPAAQASSLAAPLPASSVPLAPGWNLISIPEIPADTAPASVLASIAGSFDLVYAYNGCDSLDPWKLYDPSAPVASDLTVIDHTLGLWIHMTTAATLQVAGATPTSTAIPLCTGWNLIGYPWSQPLPLAGALYSITGKYSRVFGYDQNNVNDPWAVFTVGTPGYANDLHVMTPGRGYWVLASENASAAFSGPPGPIALSLSSHTDGSVITSPVTVTEIITSATTTTWVSDYRRKGDSTWTVFGYGDTAVNNQVFATFNPTLLLNDIYELRFTATDLFGQSASASADVVVEGAMKIGLFSISFTDLAIPVVGVPIQVIRTYDSRDKRTGDFGVGWTLEIVRGSYTNNRKPGEGWLIKNTPKTSIFPTIPCSISQETKSHITEVRFSDTDFYRFAFRVQMSGFGSIVAGGCLGQASFVQIGGRPGATLQVVGDNNVFWQNGSNQLLNFDTFQTYEPDAVLLTTAEGSEFELSAVEGVERIRDRNGNELTISADGITHSAGKSVAFTRDGEGRISRITDPMGDSLTYAYDANGDLVSVTDQVGNVTRFTYNTKHDLLDIIDPRGIKAGRNEYDASGRLIAVIDADGHRTGLTHNVAERQETASDRFGNTTDYLYDNRGNVVSQTDALGNVTSFTYDRHDNMLTETDPLGNRATFAYDAHNNLLTQTDALGNTTNYTYNSRNQILSTRDPLGHTNTNTYDASGNLLTSTDVLGNSTSHTYDAKGNLLSLTDSLSNTTTYAYDNAGNLIQQTDSLGHATAYTYDAKGNQLTGTTTRTDASGNKVTMTTTSVYDAQGRLVRTVDAAGHTALVEYNKIGKRSATVDANGRRTEYAYDDRGYLTTITYPDGTTERTAYDLEGNQTASTDRGGRTTHYEYDILNRLTRKVFPDGSGTSQQYDAAGNLLVSTNALGNSTRFAYDALGRTSIMTDALSHATAYTYDAAGNQSLITDANGHTTMYEYDALNRLTRTIFADGTATSTLYDGLGRENARTDQAGNSTQFEYDTLGRLVKVTDALGNMTRYGYDEVGNLTIQTDANGHATLFAYDNLGRRTRRVLPLGMAETTAYDAVDNLLSKTDFNGQTITYEYDANNQLIRKTFPTGVPEIYTYTPIGQRQTVTDARGLTSYEYDARDRLTRRSDPDGRSISYTYDAAGNRTAVTIPTGATLYTYDALNRLATVTDPDNGVTTYGYDAVGSRASVAYPNGTVAEYTYDSLNRLAHLMNRTSSGGTISSYTYTLGPAGNRTRVLEHTGRTVDYAYDATYKLVQESISNPSSGSQVISYTYDAVGNRLTKADNGIATAYTYDANDRMLSAGSSIYTYDDNGNTLTEDGAARDVAYGYDVQDRLVRATLTDTTGVANVGYVHDEDGIRVQQTLGATEVTNYLADKNRDFAQVLLESDGAGAATVSYIYGDDLISQRRDGNTTYYHYDGQMSTRQLTEGGQTVTDSYTYDAFGVMLARSGDIPNAYLYGGEQFDLNVGFYYLRARYMNSMVGRFWTMDPYEDFSYSSVVLHRYLYASNNPVNMLDPSGYFSLLAVSLVNPILGILISTPDMGFDPLRSDCINKCGIWLQGHEVMSGFNHLSIRITPRDQKKWTEERPSDFNRSNVDKYGNFFATIGAGTGVGRNITLTKGINRDRDVHAHKTLLIPLNPLNTTRALNTATIAENALIKRLFALHAKYRNDQTLYCLFPGGGSCRNSNSYISGLLDAADIPKPKVLVDDYPGWEQPVPRNRFN